MSYKLVVIGTQPTTEAEADGVIRYHLDTGKTWDAGRHPSPAGGTRVVAKMAGVSRVWMTGTLTTGRPFDDPESPDHSRWPWGYEVDWGEPARAGVPVEELFGQRGVRARGMIVISREEWLRARERLYPDTA